MFPILASVPGKLKTLLDRLTSTRAGLIDNLDDTITSRAPSSTALSTAVWTSTIAGRIDAAITTRAKVSVQTDYRAAAAGSAGSGEDATYVDITITAVSATTKAVPSFVGGASTISASAMVKDSAAAGSGGIVYEVTARLTSATNLRLSCPVSSVFIQGRWTVIDYGAA